MEPPPICSACNLLLLSIYSAIVTLCHLYLYHCPHCLQHSCIAITREFILINYPLLW